MDNVITSKMVSLAKEALSFFEKKERSSGVSYWTTKEECPDWVSDIVYSAHGVFLPDDFRYKFIVESLDLITENEGEDFHSVMDRTEADIYTGNLLEWLSSNLGRLYYCDHCDQIKLGSGSTMIDRISSGQVAEKQEVFSSVFRALLKRIP